MSGLRAATLFLFFVFLITVSFGGGPIHIVKAGDTFDVPSGYNSNDYLKLVSFLEQTTADGRTNGSLISHDYNPQIPSSWSTVVERCGVKLTYGVVFEKIRSIDGTEEYRVVSFNNDASFLFEGTLDLSDCSYLQDVFLPHTTLSSVLLSGCSSLMRLDVSFSKCSSLNVRGCTSLEILHACEGDFSSIGGLNDCSALLSLDVSDNSKLASLDLSNTLSTLGSLYINNTPLGDGCIDFKKMFNADEIRCSGTRFTKLDFSNCRKLTQIFCSNNNLEYVLMPDSENNLDIECVNSGLMALDLSHCSNLISLDCSGNPLKTLDLTNCLKTTYLTMNDCELNSLKLGQKPYLLKLECSGNALTELDIASAPKLRHLTCSDNHLNSVVWNCTIDGFGTWTNNISSSTGGFVGVGFFDNDPYSGTFSFFAVAKPGYKFVNWVSRVGTIVSEKSEISFELGKSYSLTAIFEPDGCAFTAEPTKIPSESPIMTPAEYTVPTQCITEIPSGKTHVRRTSDFRLCISVGSIIIILPLCILLLVHRKKH